MPGVISLNIWPALFHICYDSVVCNFAGNNVTRYNDIRRLCDQHFPTRLPTSFRELGKCK